MLRARLTTARLTMRATTRAAVGALGLAVIAGAGLGACAGSDATPPATTAPPTTVPPTTLVPVPPEEGEKIYVYVPEAGDCFDQREEEDEKTKKKTTYHLLIDCARPHVSEVYATVRYADPLVPDLKGSSFPGDEALRKFARLECPKQYEAYVGRAYELSTLTLGFVLPKPSDWPGNATIGCTVAAGGNELRAGSARGAGL